MPIQKTVNRKFFSKWSAKMAYILGFFLADGSMTKSNRDTYFMDLEITDGNLLRHIRNAFISNHAITARKRKGGRKTSYRLQIGSKEMALDLMRLGVVPRKSFRLNFPRVPKKYVSDFVRGYFDGDGHVVISSYHRAARKGNITRVIVSGFTCANRAFLLRLHAFLKEHAGIHGGSVFYNKGHRLTFSMSDSLLLYKFLYKKIGASSLYLPRKRNVFKEYFKGL